MSTSTFLTSINTQFDTYWSYFTTALSPVATFVISVAFISLVVYVIYRAIRVLALR